MSVYPLVLPLLLVLFRLSCYIVIYGRLLPRVYQALNIILSFLMISLIMCGLFPCAINLMCILYFSIFNAMSTHTSFSQYVLFSVKTVTNLTTTKKWTFFSSTVFSFVFLVPTPLLKTEKLNDLYALSMTFLELFFFMPPCLQNSRPKQFAWLPIFLIFDHPKQIPKLHPSILYF
jgi:hypothetical protein